MRQILIVFVIPLAMAAKCSSSGSVSGFLNASRTTKVCKGEAGYKSELDEIIAEFQRDFGKEVNVSEATQDGCVRGKVSHSIENRSSFTHTDESK